MLDVEMLGEVCGELLDEGEQNVLMQRTRRLAEDLRRVDGVADQQHERQV